MVNVWGGERLGGERLTIIINRSSLTEHNDWFDGEEEETDAEPRETEYEDDMTVIKDH